MLKLLALLLTLSSAVYAQEQFTTVAGQDYKLHTSSPFTNPKWDPFVKEGFDAFDRQDVQTGLEFLRKSVLLGCTSPLVLMKMGIGFESQGNYPVALQYYQMAFDNFAKWGKETSYYADFPEYYGRALYLSGNVVKAMPFLEEAAKTKPTSPILKLLIQNNLSSEDTVKAENFLEKLEKIQPTDYTAEEFVNFHLQLARLYKKADNKDMATKHYEKILTFDGDNKEARTYINESKRKSMMDEVFKIMDM
ncbi:hypothetical protein K1X76_07845 [bacterium]|nr:hypothetical protein [bacterium]